MKLSKQNLKEINPKLAEESKHLFSLPEKVLQFGTGVLLRGLPCYYIDKANRQGLFNGRIALVKSTSSGDTFDFEQQDCLYTVCIRGLENNDKKEENIISSAISRVLTAQQNWNEIIRISESKDLEIVISNTTELGITLTADNIFANPPASFPGKLLYLLYHRYNYFLGDESKGLVIVPTELISNNGTELYNCVLTLAESHNLGSDFISWLTKHNYFCNSLVDRIVPGKPDEVCHKIIENQLGYQDNLMLVAEPYSLWAIEGDEYIKSKLSFADVDDGIIITPDITLYRELKLRLLNGTHTLSCAVAFLAGFDSVRAAMENSEMNFYVLNLMQNEIAPSIPCSYNFKDAYNFSEKVLDRFKNPAINHEWLNISFNYSLKLKSRVIPILIKHYEQFNEGPDLIALGFAAYLRFMKVEMLNEGHYYGYYNNKYYEIKDQEASYFNNLWKDNTTDALVDNCLQDHNLWGEDLSRFPGFSQKVKKHLKDIESDNMLRVMSSLDYESFSI